MDYFVGFFDSFTNASTHAKTQEKISVNFNPKIIIKRWMFWTSCMVLKAFLTPVRMQTMFLNLSWNGKLYIFVYFVDHEKIHISCHLQIFVKTTCQNNLIQHWYLLEKRKIGLVRDPKNYMFFVTSFLWPIVLLYLFEHFGTSFWMGVRNL